VNGHDAATVTGPLDAPPAPVDPPVPPPNDLSLLQPGAVATTAAPTATTPTHNRDRSARTLMAIIER
jgi:hypothetical protein